MPQLLRSMHREHLHVKRLPPGEQSLGQQTPQAPQFFMSFSVLTLPTHAPHWQLF
jgi:hypothetical protein